MTADLLNNLSQYRLTSVGRGKWRSQCPAHGSKSLTLAIREADDGRCLIHCFAGCTTEEVLSSIGLTITDLFPPEEAEAKATRKVKLNLSEFYRDMELIRFARYSLARSTTPEWEAKLELAIKRVSKVPNRIKLWEKLKKAEIRNSEFNNSYNTWQDAGGDYARQ